MDKVDDGTMLQAAPPRDRYNEWDTRVCTAPRRLFGEYLGGSLSDAVGLSSATVHDLVLAVERDHLRTPCRRQEPSSSRHVIYKYMKRMPWPIWLISSIPPTTRMLVGELHQILFWGPMMTSAVVPSNVR